MPFPRRCYYLADTKQKQDAVLDRVRMEVVTKLPEYTELLNVAQQHGLLKSVVRGLRSEETKLVHKFYRSWSFGHHACALLKKKPPLLLQQWRSF